MVGWISDPPQPSSIDTLAQGWSALARAHQPTSKFDPCAAPISPEDGNALHYVSRLYTPHSMEKSLPQVPPYTQILRAKDLRAVQSYQHVGDLTIALLRYHSWLTGGDARCKDAAGRTPLFFAATKAGLAALLDHSATDVNATSKHGDDAVTFRIVETAPRVGGVSMDMSVDAQVRRRLRQVACALHAHLGPGLLPAECLARAHAQPAPAYEWHGAFCVRMCCAAHPCPGSASFYMWSMHSWCSVPHPLDFLSSEVQKPSTLALQIKAIAAHPQYQAVESATTDAVKVAASVKHTPAQRILLAARQLKRLVSSPYWSAAKPSRAEYMECIDALQVRSAAGRGNPGSYERTLQQWAGARCTSCSMASQHARVLPPQVAALQAVLQNLLALALASTRGGRTHLALHSCP